MRLVRVRQTSTGTDIPIQLTRTPIAPLRPCCHANSYLRSRDMDYNERTRKMLRTAQHRMLRLIFQTEKIQTKQRRKMEEKTFATIKNARRLTKKTAHDEDSTASQEDNLEDWIQHGNRITEEADEQMLTYNNTNWVETQRKLKCREALRIATPNPDRWTRKAAEWNPGLIISTKHSMESRKTS